MNTFGFNLNDTIEGFYAFYLGGIGFGLIYLGLLRSLIFSVFERKEG